MILLLLDDDDDDGVNAFRLFVNFLAKPKNDIVFMYYVFLGVVSYVQRCLDVVFLLVVVMFVFVLFLVQRKDFLRLYKQKQISSSSSLMEQQQQQWQCHSQSHP